MAAEPNFHEQLRRWVRESFAAFEAEGVGRFRELSAVKQSNLEAITAEVFGLTESNRQMYEAIREAGVTDPSRAPELHRELSPELDISHRDGTRQSIAAVAMAVVEQAWALRS